MENVHAVIERIHPYRPLTAKTTDTSNAVQKHATRARSLR